MKYIALLLIFFSTQSLFAAVDCSIILNGVTFKNIDRIQISGRSTPITQLDYSGTVVSIKLEDGSLIPIYSARNYKRDIAEAVVNLRKNLEYYKGTLPPPIISQLSLEHLDVESLLKDSSGENKLKEHLFQITRKAGVQRGLHVPEGSYTSLDKTIVFGISDQGNLNFVDFGNLLEGPYRMTIKFERNGKEEQLTHLFTVLPQ